MGRRPTMRDVALRSGVSVTAVSYVLSGRADKPLSAATRAKVLEAVAELDYTPNAAAAALRRGHSRVVLMVMDDTLVGEVSARTVENLTRGVHDLGYTAVSYRIVTEAELLEVVATVQPFAVMLLCFVSKHTHRRMSDLGVHHVVGLPAAVGDPREEDRPWERQIGAAQARYLLECGHTQIAYLVPMSTSPRWQIAKSRMAGAEEACREAGLQLVAVAATPPSRRLVAIELAKLREAGVGAVCAHDDLMGLAVLAAAHDRGWQVPHDLAVVGADDLPEAALAIPSLSTVKLSDAQDRQAAHDWLESALEGGAPADAGAAVLPPVLRIPRSST